MLYNEIDIDNAYLFNGTYDELINYLKSIKDNYYYDAFEHVKNAYPNGNFFNTCSCEDVEYEKSRSYMDKLYEQLMYGYNENNEYYGFVNFYCCVYFNKGKTLIIFFGDSVNIRNAVRNAIIDNKLKMFLWRKDTQVPRWFTTSEWKERGDIYHSLFDDGSSYDDKGFTYSFLKGGLDSFCFELVNRYVKYIEDTRGN